MGFIDASNTDDVGNSGGTTLPPSPDAVIDSLRDLVGSHYLNHDAASVQIRAGALFARLKALNRASNVATRNHKQITSDARHEMDQTYLGLQNLLYEKRHLQREIEKCRQFASVYQDIPLYDLEEFVERAPADMKTGEVLNDEHLLTLKRLHFELAERQRLDQKYKELIQQKEDLLKESKTKGATLDQVKVQVDTLMKTALEVQRQIHELVPVSTESTTTSESTPVLS